MSFKLTVEYDPENNTTEQSDSNTLVLEVSRMHTVAEISSTVFKQAQSELRHPQETYCLFWPDAKKWLTTNKPIGQILRGVTSAQLQYKPKIRPFKIRFLDASSKRILIDETLPVKELVSRICTQLKLQHPEEKSLVVAVDYAVTKHHPASGQDNPSRLSPSIASRKELSQSYHAEAPFGLSPKSRRKHIPRPGSAGGRSGIDELESGKRRKSAQLVVTKKKQLSRKYQIRIDTPWLDPNKTLIEQEVTCDDELILMYRYYYNMHIERDSKEIELLYKQARAMFLAGEMMSTLDEVPQFTALLCQITKGSFVSKEVTQDLLQKLKKLLAPPKFKTKTFVKDVVGYHQSLKGLSSHDAKCWFVKLWSTVNLFGTEFLSCTNFDTKEKGLLGISKQKIVFLSNKKKTQPWEKNLLTHWEHDTSREIVTLHFQDSTPDTLTVHLPEYSSVLIDCLEGHRELSMSISDSQLLQQEYEFDEVDDEKFCKYCNMNDTRAPSASKTHKRADSLTHNEMMVSPEEEKTLKESSWENPTFENLDQLMEERFSFLDFNEEMEDTESTRHLEIPITSLNGRGLISKSPSPHHPSPLLRSNNSSSSQGSLKKPIKQDSSSGSSSDEDMFDRSIGSKKQ